MTLVLRGFDDLLADAIVTSLRAFSASQEALKAGTKFTVHRDRTRPPSTRELPLVNVWTDGNSPEAKGSTPRTLSQETVTVNVDLIAYSDTDDASIEPGPAASLRLAYLKEQVRHGLYQLAACSFGFSPDLIARKTWPTWQLYKDDSGNPEETIIGGRWTFEVTYAWTPEGISGQTYEGVSVVTDLYQALFDRP